MMAMMLVLAELHVEYSVYRKTYVNSMVRVSFAFSKEDKILFVYVRG